MKNVEIVSHLTEFESIDELNENDKKLLLEAKLSMKDAYAPYSRFLVGAAVLLANGIIVKGNNQENASYPVGLCAERVAVFSASANYPGIAIIAIAVSAKSDLFNVNKPVPPCGSCRQAVAEYEHRFKKNIRIILSGENGKVLISESMSVLLPLQFEGDALKI